MKKIVVVGGGTMGLDIAHTFARSGHAVVVREISDELAEKSHSRLVAALDKLVARGKMDEAKRAEILGNMTFTTDLAAAADADLVLEAIVENLDVKKSLFQELDGICKADTIFATNTSSISITAIAAATQRADRFIGMHFFNPATVMKLVEVIRGVHTSQETYDAICQLSADIGKEAVEVAEAPGFVVNGTGARFVSESMEYKQALRVFKEQDSTDFYWIFDEISRQGMVPSGNSYRLDYTFLFDTGDIVEAANYTELAEKVGLPDLPATLEAINEHVANGTEDEFGNAKIRHLLLDGPMYALKVTPTPYIAQGGLAIDLAGHVCREDGSTIPGLYAAGDVTGSVENRDGAMYRIGLTQAIAYGHIAGQTMASEM